MHDPADGLLPYNHPEIAKAEKAFCRDTKQAKALSGPPGGMDMTVNWIKDARTRRVAWIAAIVAALPQLFFPALLPKDYPAVYPILLAVVLGAFAWLVFTLRFEIRSWWGVLIQQLLVGGAAGFIIHLPMYARSYAAAMAVVYTACIGAALGLIFFAVIGSGKWFGALWLVLCWLYGIINYEVFEFTGNMISFSQILSVRTGMNVVAGYHFALGPYIISATILFALSLFALLRMRESSMGRLRVRAAALVCAAVAAALPVHGYRTLRPRTWKSNAMYRGIGIPLELLLEYRSYRIDPPEGYSAEAASKLAGYAAPAGESTETDVRPNVIAIMFEAFSDIGVLGDFETDVDPLAYTRSLAGESIHGQYLASTLAGGTSRTEWEFLTGNSMYYMPADSIPFRQYIDREQNSLVRAFKSAGYHTIGMHCFDGSGWDRYKVYPLMGFDDVYFEKDLEWDGRVRKYVSDVAFVHQVEQLFEARDASQPLFLFGVSMQNHGGYTEADFEPMVHILGMDIDRSQEEQYLSLVKMTDDAVRDLIEYFRQVEEPLEIVIFGDHQPGLTADFYSALGVDQIGYKYLVPYVIWKNYDGTAEETALTSANFLSARTLRESGVPQPAYFRYLDALSETIPAICGHGFQYDGAFYPRESEVDDRSAAALNEYGIYAYANLFDPDADAALYNGTPAGQD